MRSSGSRLIKTFMRDDSGQAITEYVLLLSMALATAIGLARFLLKALDRMTLAIGAQLERDLKTGRANLNVWQN